MTNDPNDILKQIRERGKQQAAEDVDSIKAEPSAAPKTDPNDILRQIRERGNQQEAEPDDAPVVAPKRKDLHSLLEELDAAANANRPKRTLTDDEQRTLDALQDIQSKLEQDQHVQNRRLKTWLTDEQYASIDELWQQQRELREELQDKPDAITEYEERLRVAILYNNRADYYRRQGKTKAANDMDSKCVNALEDLLERYAEMTHEDQSLHAWFDRQLDWAHGGDATADLASVPRPITSTSSDAQAGGHLMRRMSKREVKADVVERAIDVLIYEYR